MRATKQLAWTTAHGEIKIEQARSASTSGPGRYAARLSQALETEHVRLVVCERQRTTHHELLCAPRYPASGQGTAGDFARCFSCLSPRFGYGFDAGWRIGPNRATTAGTWRLAHVIALCSCRTPRPKDRSKPYG